MSNFKLNRQKSIIKPTRREMPKMKTLKPANLGGGQTLGTNNFNRFTVPVKVPVDANEEKNIVKYANQDLKKQAEEKRVEEYNKMIADSNDALESFNASTQVPIPVSDSNSTLQMVKRNSATPYKLPHQNNSAMLPGLGTFTRAQELAGQQKGTDKSLKFEQRRKYNRNTGEFVLDSYDKSYPVEGQEYEFYQRPSYYQDLPMVQLPGLPGGLDLGGGKVRMIDEQGDPMYSSEYIPTDDAEIPQKAFVDNLDKTQLQPGYKWYGPIEGDEDGKEYYSQIGGDPSRDFRMALYPKEKFEDEDRMRLQTRN